MASANSNQARVTRSPNGCDGKPVLVALTKAERKQLEDLAVADNKSLSAKSRELMLDGGLMDGATATP
ncbi:hypothetical protein [Motiliproteus sp.]|uniref:hypothetical protein n=1 Tax=Motiliproteus sp. TaxID=1898955 RepID=UPI003BA8CB20